MTNETIEQRAERIVRQEVYVCLSSLVSTLASGAYDLDAQAKSEFRDLCEQAFELAAPVADYEEAAIQAGWKRVSSAQTETWQIGEGDEARFAVGAEDACYGDRLDPYDREVYEHWTVSDWLADKLEEQGEKVDKDFANMCVWARTTTGQGIASDSCIEAIARKVEEEYQAIVGAPV